MRLNPVFTSGAVFAEGKPIRIFGQGSGTVCAQIGPHSVRKTCTGSEWFVELPAMEAGGPYDLLLTLNGEEKILSDIYIGSVFLIAGQSNAEFTLSQSNTPACAYADDGLLRCFTVDRADGRKGPLSSANGWISARTDGIGNWSALGYLVAREFRAENPKAVSKAVGIICCCQGATVIESWLPASAARRFRLPDSLLHGDHVHPDYAETNRNGVVFDRMLSTLLPYAFTGVVWLQGESDTTEEEASIYADELTAFFEILRSLDRDPDLPAALVQIADFLPRMSGGDEGWTGIQRAQEEAAGRDRKTVLVVSKDVCENDCIHPPTKTLLAKRIACALTALCEPKRTPVTRI